MLNKHTILVIDDDPDFSTALADLLDSEGYDVLCADSGTTGLACARAQAPDLVLLDHRMPGLTGQEVFEHLRESEFDKPVVLMTAASQVAAIADRMGVDRFLGKPFEAEELLWTLEDALEGIRP